MRSFKALRRPAQHPLRIRIVAPAGPADPVKLNLGIKHLEQAGFKVLHDDSLLRQWGHLAGTDQERAKSLMDALLDPDSDIVMAARGGFGCARLLPLLDYAAIAESAPTLVGYSDLSALQLALIAQCDLPSLHAPMVATEWAVGLDELSLHSQLPFLKKGLAGGGEQPFTLNPEQVCVAGKAEGWLAASNLSVLTSLAGTPWSPDFRGAVLFLEDYGEYPFRLDRHLAQLRNSGVLAGLKAIVLGHFFDCDEPDPQKDTFSMEELLAQYFYDLGIPVIRNFAFGHRGPRLSLPQGGQVILDTNQATLRIRALWHNRSND